MNTRDELLIADAKIQVVNKIIDYAESLGKLTKEDINKKDIASAKEYLFAANVLKKLAEDIMEELEWVNLS